ncbi:hypothetical protein Tco_0602763, partial [Tanacetum coccineum]
LKKGKAKLVEPQVDEEEMLQLQKQLEEEEAFYNGCKLLLFFYVQFLVVYLMS